MTIRTYISMGLIREERGRQLFIHEYDDDHDNQLTDGELIDAALCYLDAAAWQTSFPNDQLPPLGAFNWPFEPDRWKPHKDRNRNLVKAAALIAAELDRLHRYRTNDYVSNMEVSGESTGFMGWDIAPFKGRRRKDDES